MSQQRVKAIIKTVLKNVYDCPGGCESLVSMHLQQERDEAAPRMVELKTRVEELEKMLFWSYTFSADQITVFDEHEAAILECGGRPPDPFTWGISLIEDDYQRQDDYQRNQF